MKKSRFTLLELVTVMIVMIILFGIGATALTGLTTKKGPEGGVRMTTRMIELSRQYAISTNTRVALMLPMESSATLTSPVLYTDFKQSLPVPDEIGRFGDNVTADTPGVIMRPAVVDSSRNFLRWIEDTKWVGYPSGAYFATNEGVSDVAYTEAASASKTLNNGTVKALIFKPNGSLAGTTSDAVIYVKPYSAGGSGTSYRTGTAHRYMITVNWLTGKVRTIRDDESSYVGKY